MLRIHSSLIVAAALVLSACGDVGDAPRAQTDDAVTVAQNSGEALAIDTSRSAINWKAAKVTRAHDGGFNTFYGTISVADNQVVGADIMIDTRSIWSDTQRLTNHLKSPDFFDVETYSQAQFVANQIEPADSTGATHLVTGNLTMHGQTKAVTFPATISLEDDDVRAAADFIIDRRDWGINYKGQADDLVENSVRLILDVVASTAPVVSPVAAEAAAE